MTKKIVVLNNFGDDRIAWIKRISKQSPLKNKWKDFELTPSIEDSDYVVILDGVSHISKNEFICSFFGRILGLTVCF